MALIKWSPSYSVKVSESDRQHQKLIDMINELNDAMTKGKGRDVLGGILDALILYTQTHFAMEERYFDQFKYPETAEHKAQHAAFVKKIKDFREGFTKNQMSVTINLMDFLSDWLVKHICGTDKKYSDFFNKNGIN